MNYYSLSIILFILVFVKYKLLLPFIFFILLYNTTQAQFTPEWLFNAKNINGTGGYKFGWDIATDSLGNSYVIGEFNATADFDPGPGVYNLTSIGLNDGFYAKYDPSGNLVFAYRFGYTLNDYASSLVFDNLGYFYMAGSYEDDISFPGVGGPVTLSGFGPSNTSYFFGKFDLNGNCIFVKGAWGHNNVINIGLDNYNNILLSGTTFEIDFDPSPAYVGYSPPLGSQGLYLAKYDTSGNFIYGKGTDYAYPQAMDVDTLGNIYLTGSFGGTVDFDLGTGTAIFTSVPSSVDIFIAKYDTLGNYIFVKTIGGTATDQGNSITVDNNSNIYITGEYWATTDFDPGLGVSNLINSDGFPDAFVAKYDATGNYIFSTKIGDADNDKGKSILLDNNKNIYVAGQFADTIDVDPGPGVFMIYPDPSLTHNSFIIKYDSLGILIDGNVINTSITSIAFDSSTNVFATGFFSQTADFDPSPATAIITTPANLDVFIAKYDSNCDYLWAGHIGNYAFSSPYNEFAKKVLTDSNGNIYVAGFFTDVIDFDPGPGTAILSSGTTNDIFFAKYDSLGNYQYAKSISSTGYDGFNTFAMDATGNIYITGTFGGTADFDTGPGTYTITDTGSAQDMFIAKYDNLGNLLFAVSTPTIYLVDPTSIEIDNSGNIIVAGSFVDTVDFDSGIGSDSLISAGGYDFFVAKYDPVANLIFANSFGGIANDRCNAIAVDTSNNIYITGYFRNTVDFDPGVALANFTSAGNDDIFFAKYDAGGNYIYSKCTGSFGQDRGRSILLDNLGNIFLAGEFSGTIDPDPSALSDTLISTGAVDVFYGKYDTNGNYKFARSIGGGNDGVNEITLGNNGHLYICGSTNAIMMDFDPGPDTVYEYGIAGGDLFFAEYDTINGDYMSSAIVGSVNLDYAYSLCYDNGDLILAGAFTGIADMDPGAGEFFLQSNSGFDMFVGKYNLSSSTVWPGDANSDNITNNNDLLPIGLYYGETGSARSTISNTWQAFPAVDFGTTMAGGADIKNADCNGDGIIDDNDTLAINLNFSLVHAFAPEESEVRLLASELYFSSASTSYAPGDWVNVDVMLGTATLPVTNIYGIAFNVNYNSSLVQPGSENISYPTSWLGAPGTNAITIGKVNPSGNMLYGGATRIDHNNTSGNGNIATFRFRTLTSISSLSVLNLSIETYMANLANGSAVSLDTSSYNILIDPGLIGINTFEKKNIVVYPNPSPGTFHISGLKKGNQIIVTDMLGKIILEKIADSEYSIIELKEKSNGIYFYKIIDAGAILKQDKIIVY